MKSLCPQSFWIILCMEIGQDFANAILNPIGFWFTKLCGQTSFLPERAPIQIFSKFDCLKNVTRIRGVRSYTAIRERAAPSSPASIHF